MTEAIELQIFQPGNLKSHYWDERLQVEKRCYYDNGLPFDTTLAKNLDKLLKRIKRLRKAVLITIDGGVGEGKTTLGIHVADYLNGAYVWNLKTKRYDLNKSKLVDLRRQYAMGGLEFQERLQMCIDSLLQALMYDEGGDFNKRGSLTQFNQQINRVFDVMRTFQIPILLALPYIGILDKDLFVKGIVRMHLHTSNRKVTYGKYSAYGLYRLMYVLDKMKKMVVPQQAFAKTVPNFFGQFLDLPPDRAAELAKICDEGKKSILTQNVLKNRGLVSLPDLAKDLGITKQYANHLLRKLNIKEDSILKRIRYFGQDTRAQLSAQLVRKR